MIPDSEIKNEVENAILQSNEPKEWKFDQYEESDE